MTYQEQTPQDRPQLTLVHSLPKDVLPSEPSSVSPPLHSIDNPNRIPTVATLEPSTIPADALPGQAEGKVIDAREAFEEARRHAAEAAAGVNRPLRQKVSNILGKFAGPFF
ncbi:hypothetical protein EYC58_03350 [Candidatus Saccharibacteria bacterium]|nr:MAG: hypothetical protein EYC58_03350 [Candidatus Saccharibacteria bacterium]